MAQLIDIQKVVIGPDAFTATVRVADSAPLFTSEDVEATARVYWLMPHIADHACVGDGGKTFKEVMGDTSLAHLLEHVTLEFLAQTSIAGDISEARTRKVDEARTYEVQLACPDDVLVASALSSAVWVLQWAFGSAEEASKPNTKAIVEGIVSLVRSASTMAENEAPAPQEPSSTPALASTDSAAREPEIDERQEPAAGEALAGDETIYGYDYDADTGASAAPFEGEELSRGQQIATRVAELSAPEAPQGAFEVPLDEPVAKEQPVASPAPREPEPLPEDEADALAGLDLVIHHAQEAERQAQANSVEPRRVSERYGVTPSSKQELKVRQERDLDLRDTVGFMDARDGDPLGGDLD